MPTADYQFGFVLRGFIHSSEEMSAIFYACFFFVFRDFLVNRGIDQYQYHKFLILQGTLIIIKKDL